MSSFTSSSRAIYRKTLAAILLGMGAAMGSFYLFTIVMDADQLLGRVTEAREALPKIVKEDQDLVMMFGSSMVDAGFSPRQFDREVNAKGKNVKSFNFGFGGLNPFFQDYLSRRIAEAFKRDNRRLKLAIIEFNPFQATQARWNGAVPAVDAFLTRLASPQELWEITKKDPTRGALLFNIKYLRNEVSAEMVTTFFGRGIFPPEQAQRIPEPESYLEARKELDKKLEGAFEKDFPDYDGSDWYYPWQGGGTIPEDRSEGVPQDIIDYLATFSSPEAMQNYRNRRISSADIEGLNFEPLLLESFIGIVKNFQTIADEVVIVMLPRNHQVISYSPEAESRLNAAIQQIESATNEKIENHQLITEVTYDMFRDATHLARYTGDVAYTHFLAEEYLDKL
ncbi:MAG: hypothetical protein HWE27_00430 [Gammaproteobacteria bacterium]|nr:hypothetical protein [Gammaproteobacteria bacterium]